jgi:hypothetical protein
MVARLFEEDPFSDAIERLAVSLLTSGQPTQQGEATVSEAKAVVHNGNAFRTAVSS